MQGVEADCCNLGGCAAGLVIQSVITWEVLLQGLSYAGS